MKKENIWTIIKLVTIILCMVAFSPIVVSPREHLPYLIGLPFSLGAGILVSIGLILLVILGACFATQNNENNEGA